MLTIGSMLFSSVNPPTFSESFYTGQQSLLQLNKGGAHYAANGGICCSKTKSSQCRFEAMNQGTDVWQSAELKMHRFGSVVNNYTLNYHKAEEFGREMAVVPSSQMPKYANSSHKWACAVYCPLQQGTYYNLVEVGTGRKQDPVSFIGNVTVTQSSGACARSTAHQLTDK